MEINKTKGEDKSYSTILIFDYWNKAIKEYLLPILKKLDNNKCRIILVNFSSISGNIEPNYKLIDGIHCYDYSAISKFRINKIFDKFNPYLVIILNNTGMLDRAIIKYANYLNIPIYYIQHGLSKPNYLGEMGLKKLLGKKYSFKRYIKKTRQYIYYFIIYLYVSLLIDRYYLFKKEYYYILLTAMIDPVKFLNFLPVSRQHIPKFSFVFGNKDKEALINHYGYPSSSIIVCGFVLFEDYLNYLDKKCEIKQKMNLSLVNLNIKSPIILFLPSIFVEWNVPGFSEDDYVKTLNNLYNITYSMSYQLIIKLHPSADGKLYEFLKGQTNVWITRDSDLLELIWISDLIIAEPTTAIFPAVLLKKKIILLRLIKQLNYDFDFVREGVAIDCQTIDDLKELLNNYEHLDEIIDYKNYDIFLNNYCNYSNLETSKVIAKHIQSALT